MKTFISIVAITILIFGCTPKKDYKDKMIEFAINDLHKNLKVPSSLVVDSTNIEIVKEHVYDTYVGLYRVDLYYQAQNSFGALLKRSSTYYIDRNPQNGKLKIYDKLERKK